MNPLRLKNFFKALLPGVSPPISNRSRLRRPLRIEPLESRRVLALITVNSLSDEPDATAETVNLREAIEFSNSNGEKDTIVFAPEATGVIQLKGEPLIVQQEVEIIGPGSEFLTIDGDEISRLLITDEGSTVELSGMTLTGGSATGVLVLADSSLRIRDVVFANLGSLDNASTTTGGAIENRGELDVETSTFTENEATLGGAIYSSGRTRILGSTFSHNKARQGGAINAPSGFTDIRESTFISNSAEREHLGSEPAEGGAVLGRTAVSNSTLAENSADLGGAIMSAALVTASTITQNTTRLEGRMLDGRFLATGAVDNGGSHHSAVAGSIIAGNTGGDLEFRNPFTHSAGGLEDKSGNVVGGDPKLGPLADNGGPTQTFALRAGSPAIDAGSWVVFLPQPTLDQRGKPRVFGEQIDAGAYEYHRGVTLITHGWEATPDTTGPPNWTLDTARALGRRFGAANIFLHDSDPESKSYGQWIPLTTHWTNTDDSSDELILVHDWSSVSNHGSDGWLRSAADSLFAGIRNAPFELGEELFHRPIHFIGHGRGAVLNSLTVERLGVYYPDLVIDQVTSLDPHPIQAGEVAGVIYESDDPNIFTFNNVAYADNYFRQDPPYQSDLDFDGVEVPGAWNLELNESILALDGGEKEHFDVRLWYLATIDIESTQLAGVTVTPFMTDNWWASGIAFSHSPELSLEENSGRANVGFNRSRTGEQDRSRMAVTISKAPLFNPIIVNGDFEFGDAASDEIPGWERHGGQHDVDLTEDGRLHFGETGSVDHTRASHNPFYIPRNAKFLLFDYEVTEPSDDVLEVRNGDALLASIPLNSRGVKQTPPIWIGDFGNTIGNIDLQLSWGIFIDSQAYIDDLAIVTGDKAWQNAIDPYDINASGTITVLDGHILIHELRFRGVNALLPDSGPGHGQGPWLDTNGNDRVDLIDAFGVVDRIRDAFNQGAGEGEFAASSPTVDLAPPKLDQSQILDLPSRQKGQRPPRRIPERVPQVDQLMAAYPQISAGSTALQHLYPLLHLNDWPSRSNWAQPDDFWNNVSE